MKTAFDNGINMFDVAEAYAKGKSEIELYVRLSVSRLYLTVFPPEAKLSKRSTSAVLISSSRPKSILVCDRDLMPQAYRENSE